MGYSRQMVMHGGMYVQYAMFTRPTIDAYPLTDFTAYFGRHSTALLLALSLLISVLPTMIYLSDILAS